MLTINSRHKPLRGTRAIAAYLKESFQITARMLARGTIDADRDGKVYVTTPERIDRSFAGARRVPSDRGEATIEKMLKA